MRAILEKELTNRGYYELDNELDQMGLIQKMFAETYTFENIDVLLKHEQPITKEFLINKMLKKKRGGLCYELNGLLHIVLKELGFDVTLASATVWSPEDEDWIIDRTHTVNLFQKDGGLYLLDCGSGTNLSHYPLLLNGDPVESTHGTYRFRTAKTERGSLITERLTEDGWMLRYALYPDPVDWEDLNRIKEMIHHHPDSPFSQKLLLARTLDDGTVSITNDRMNRKRTNGHDERIPFDTNKEILDKLHEYGSKSTYEAAKEYFKEN